MEQPTTTDWIQSIAILFSVPYTIWSTVMLFRKDKSKEAKLKSLESQVAIMQKQLDLNHTIARVDRQPVFSIDSSPVSENGFLIKLRNIGQLAIIAEVDIKNKDQFRLETIDLIGKRVESHTSVTIMATYNEYYKEHEPDHVHFPITERIEISVLFTDTLGTTYIQHLTKPEGAGISFIISEPSRKL